MKKSLLNQKTLLRRGGVLSQTTRQILAGAGMLGVAASLTSCGDSSVTTFNEEDMYMARVADEVQRVDEGTAQLSSGEVANNFHIAGLGYYHAGAGNFFEHPYQFRGPDGRYFVNGDWLSEPGPAYVAPSRPTPEALEKTQQALAAAQTKEPNNGSNVQQHQGGFGMGNMLLMYMLLSGNRGLFSQGAAFQNAQTQAPKWQQNVNQQRSAVQSHAAANPKFRQMVTNRTAMGQSVNSGQSVRGGVGTTGRSSSSGVFSSGS